MKEGKKSQRIIGLDFARGVAVWGMLLMNFKIVMTKCSEGVLGKIAFLLEGHYGVMFVMLAGMGISLFMKNAIESHDKELLRKKRKILLKRACFLMILGLVFSLIWPADILHYYGVYIFIGAYLVQLNKKVLCGIIALTTLLFPVLMLIFPYETGWDFHALSYIDFWSIKGFIRHTFYNGFHPVFPWISFLFMGILFGRADFSRSALKWYFITALIIAVTTELLSFLLVSISSEELAVFFVRDAMPPSPLFVIASAAEAVVMIIFSIFAVDFLKEHFIVKPIVFTGQMVLSHYIFHVFIGFGILDELGSISGYSLKFTIFYATLYFIGSVIFSQLWGSRFSRGPVELFMRKVSG